MSSAILTLYVFMFPCTAAMCVRVDWVYKRVLCTTVYVTDCYGERLRRIAYYDLACFAYSHLIFAKNIEITALNIHFSI